MHNMQQNQEESYPITWIVAVTGCLAAQLDSSRTSSLALHLTVLVFYASRLETLLSLCVNSTLHKLLLLAEQPHHMELPHSTGVAPHCYVY